MKYYRTLLLATPLLLLAGCNSSSNDSKSEAAATSKPLADHKFTDTERDELLDERQQILESMRLVYQGQTYDQVSFAESFGEQMTLVKLSTNNGSHSLDLLLQNGRETEPCVIYQNQTNFATFRCDTATRSIGNDTTLIDSVTHVQNEAVRIEYYSEAEEYLGSVGSTVLTPAQSGNQMTITTSFAFNEFYRDIFGNDGSTERINSTLGATTYLQLNEIVQNFSGSSMTMAFNNHIGGSADDDINMYTGLLIHNQEMTTVVNATGSVFSGGTDLFAAGKLRILNTADASQPIEASQQVGVHSWGQGDKTAKDFPYTDKSHRKQATYFNTVMGDKGIDFYLFTLDSAPANGEHWVTKSDSDKYIFINEIN
ncbi:alpha/beta hydrolase [Vibrio profundi]|uniref:alpha/beta hydrolase n=1 Tax=Vibrio profundi TaxID=1774960 RepID=UPI0037350942